jgi:hypothetical protein
MDSGIRERVETLRREIAEIQELNLEYLRLPRPQAVAAGDHARREERLRDIMAELKSMTDWKRT